jgi:GH25 family lysozyme M1 (1,4-beta-N-acetylmuramidase)
MKKIIKVILIIIVLSALVVGGIFAYKKYQEYLEEERIKNAIVKIEYIEPLVVEYNREIKLSDLIVSINGKLVDDFKIDTSKIGEKEISYKYINEEDIKLPQSFKLKIVDQNQPVIWLSNSYTVTVGTKSKLEELIMYGDDYDDNPTCKITGEYDVNKVGNYNLSIKVTDSSGNSRKKDFTLKVVNPSKGSNNSSGSGSSIPFSDLYKQYKNENTTIGIDVSRWQGDIDFEKVKEAGVEFVFIKLGGQNGINGDYYLDPKFERNIKGFKEVGIPVGLYFYSYANSIDKAKSDALWVIDQIKDYQIDLPIAFDWENWSKFNSFHVSFNTLTKSAGMFIDTLKKHGYEGMLYSSKNYLEQIWLKNDYPTWLAHYTNRTDYQGEFKCWQRTSSAKISGITANTVDVDICYK